MSEKTEITFMQTKLIRLASEEWHLDYPQRLLKACEKGLVNLVITLFNFMESHNFLKNPHSHQLWSWSSQKKEKLPYPRCGLGAYLRCG